MRRFLRMNAHGFGLIEVMIAVAVMAIVTLELATTFQNMNSNSMNLKGALGAQSLKSTLIQIMSKSNSCMSHLMPNYKTFNIQLAGPGGTGLPIGFNADDGGSQIFGATAGGTPVPVPNYAVGVTSLLFTSQSTTPIGFDTGGGPTNGAAIYLGAVTANLIKLSPSLAVAGGVTLPPTTIGSLMLEVDSSNNIVSCYAQPLSAIDACSSLGGTFVATAQPQCQLPYPCTGPQQVFMGYDANQNAICTSAASLSVLNCQQGHTVISTGAGYICN